jgi:hypothetical protein
MSITPEDLIYGWDPFKEDPLLGFKKLRKDELFEKALYRAMRDRHIKSKEDITSYFERKEVRYPVGASAYIDRLASNLPNAYLFPSYKDFSQDLIDEFIVVATQKLEEEGYTQFENHALPEDVMVEMADWCVKEMIDKGVLPNEPELVNLVMRSYK